MWKIDFLICLNKVRSFSNSVGLLPILESETTEKQWDNMILQKISSDRIAIITERNSQMGKQKEVSYESLKGKRFVIHARNDYEDGFWEILLINILWNMKIFLLLVIAIYFLIKFGRMVTLD